MLYTRSAQGVGGGNIPYHWLGKDEQCRDEASHVHKKSSHYQISRCLLRTAIGQKQRIYRGSSQTQSISSFDLVDFPYDFSPHGIGRDLMLSWAGNLWIVSDTNHWVISAFFRCIVGLAKGRCFHLVIPIFIIRETPFLVNKNGKRWSKYANK